MENVVNFPARAPREGEMMTVSLEEMMQVFTKQKTLQDIAWERHHAEVMARVMALDVPTLRDLWDRFPEDGSHVVDGYDLDDVHAALNAKGDGEYCAV